MKRSYSYILSLLALLLTVSGIHSLGVLANPQLAQHKPKNESKYTELTLKKDSTEILLPLDENEELDFSLVHTLEYEEDASLPFIKNETPTPWADSVFNSLTVKERVAQLFMVAAYSNRDAAHKTELIKLITEEKIGGLIFFQGDPASQMELTKCYQDITQTPLWLGMDIEWGLSMRLSNSIHYPYQMTLGAMDNDSLVYEMGAQIAQQMKRMGVHVSFSPVLDVNNNPNNPVINYRSFGENRENVSEKGLMYIKGLQENGVLACAKHFPGHGDTDMDSHLALPTVNHNRNRLDSIELFPFKNAINEGVGSIMVAHLHIPVLDNRENRATTLSSATVNTLLKKQLNFKGLSFTDALNMKGVAKYFQPGEVDLEALKAGNDVLLFPEDVPQAIKKIMAAIASGEISEETINTRCLKILKTKEWLGLNKKEKLDKTDLVKDLNSEEFNWLNQRLADASITLLRNENNTLPFLKINENKTAVINIGADRTAKHFGENLEKYLEVQTFNVTKTVGFSEIQNIANELKTFDRVIVNILGTSNKPKKDFGITDNINLLLSKMDKNKENILTIYTNAYSLYKLKNLDNFSSIMVAYQDSKEAQKAAADAIIGAIKINGKLPVSAGQFMEGDGITIGKTIRIRRDVSPFELGLNPSDLKKIDTIALRGIKEKAYPGCRVLAIKSGNVIVDRSYGHQTYEKRKKVTNQTVYDLASITKIASTTLSLLQLTDLNKFDPNNNLCDYLADIADTSDYFNMNLKEMLSHTAGLKPWIPFYDYTLVNKTPSSKYYRNFPKEGYFKVADKLYIDHSYADSIYYKILTNPLRDKRNYKYSDLGYYLIYRMFPHMTSLSLEDYVSENFYTPLGLKTIGYHPLKRMNKNLIAPTENDRLFRNQVLRGYVHDPGAAMLGGACGHAGLFSNAYDIATIMQLFLDKGNYAGEQFFNSTTFDFYNTTHFAKDKNRRGVGFDKPMMNPDSGSACNSASASSFGHSGFTGTLVWADPEKDLVYVFLSNRVYPDAGNRKLIDMNIRTDIQQVLYDAIDKAEQRNS